MPRVIVAVAGGAVLGCVALAVCAACFVRDGRVVLPRIALTHAAAAPDVVYVNLDRRPDRRAWMEHQLAKTGLAWRRQAAVDGRAVDLAAQVAAGVLTPAAAEEIHLPNDQKTFGITLTRGAVGCALSHIEAWERAAQSRGPTVILEDDIELHHLHTLQARLRDVPSDWDVVYLGSGQYVKAPPRTARQAAAARRGVHPVQHAYQFIGYMVHPRSAAKLRAVLPLSYQIDGAVQELPLVKYVLEPNLVVPRRDMHSDIQIID